MIVSYIVSIMSMYVLQEVADDIRLTLAQAFEICYQKVMRVRMMSPESK